MKPITECMVELIYLNPNKSPKELSEIYCDYRVNKILEHLETTYPNLYLLNLSQTTFEKAVPRIRTLLEDSFRSPMGCSRYLDRLVKDVVVILPGVVLPNIPGEFWSTPILPHHDAQFLITKPIGLFAHLEFSAYPTTTRDYDFDAQLLHPHPETKRILENNLLNNNIPKPLRRETYFPTV